MFQARMRAESVAGAFVATIVLCAFLAPPVLILALIVWLMVRASRSSSSRLKPEVDPAFSARFHGLEQGILNANVVDAKDKK
ncbi:MAG TPA: hypothetical protein VGS16_03390 [Candidatus Dormibacteraeota bacterium]|nr:hypothetical protein [Candidatus Dormibacteraeota bacterium]